MKEELITFETAKLAKEKGFIENCLYFYYEDSKKDSTPTNYLERSENILKLDSLNQILHKNSTVGRFISAPTQSLLQKWIREVHNIHITIKTLSSCKFVSCINHFDDDNDKYLEYKDCYKYLNYEQALEEGLKQALKLIK